MARSLNAEPMTSLIRKHLEQKGSISGIEAAALYRCRSLTKRVSELRASGLAIAAVWHADRTGQRYVRYYRPDAVPAFQQAAA